MALYAPPSFSGTSLDELRQGSVPMLGLPQLSFTDYHYVVHGLPAPSLIGLAPGYGRPSIGSTRCAVTQPASYIEINHSYTLPVSSFDMKHLSHLATLKAVPKGSSNPSSHTTMITPPESPDKVPVIATVSYAPEQHHSEAFIPRVNAQASPPESPESVFSPTAAAIVPLRKTSRSNIAQPKLAADESSLVSSPVTSRRLSFAAAAAKNTASTRASSFSSPSAPTAATLASTASESDQTPKSKIKRNRLGQRIDPYTPYNKTIDDLKKKKLCNTHFLRKTCPYGKKCTHSHDYKMTPKDFETLVIVARLAPCFNGLGCTDPDCIYGHVCPQEEPNSHKAKGRGKFGCTFGDSCRFPAEMHGIDRVIVKEAGV